MAKSVRDLKDWLETLDDTDMVGISSDDLFTLVEYESFYSELETRWFEVGDIDE